MRLGRESFFILPTYFLSSHCLHISSYFFIFSSYFSIFSTYFLIFLHTSGQTRRGDGASRNGPIKHGTCQYEGNMEKCKEDVYKSEGNNVQKFLKIKKKVVGLRGNFRSSPPYMGHAPPPPKTADILSRKKNYEEI